MQIFTNFTLKIIAIILMVIDHIYTYIGTSGVNIPIWFGYLGKLSAPIFFYLIVEGFFHTRSRENYMKRLFGMGIFMILVDIVFKINNNIFLSLGFGMLLMYFIEYAKDNKNNSKNRIKGILLAILSGLLVCFTEASVYGLGMILIFYFLRDKKVIMSLAYVLFSLLELFTAIGPNFIQQVFLSDYQWMMVFAIIPILMYNGKIGFSNKFVKWIFYWFYPTHLIFIVTIANIIGSSSVQEPVKFESDTQINQEIVTDINAKIEFVSDKKLYLKLSSNSSNFSSVCIVNLYDEESNADVAYKVIKGANKKSVIEQKIKVLSGNKLVKGKTYILDVYDGENEKVLFKDKIILE